MRDILEISAEEIAAAKTRLPRAFSETPRQRLTKLIGWSLFIGLVAYTLIAFNFSPERIWTGLGKLGFVLSFMLPPYVWPSWELFMEPVTAIGETLAMAFLGTLLAGIVALPLGFLGAKNILKVEWMRFGVRRGFDTLRAFEQLVLALIFIRAFGLGPLAGIFAIMVSDIGSLSKLFAEAIENVENKQIEGVKATGAGPLQTLRLAVLPQVLPVMLSNLLYYLESNTRSATILGVVGAGGVGFLLYDRISANNWDEVMSIVILILITVYAIDSLSGWLRGKIIGKNEYRP
ncbi:phosphonate ABC transporter, permease protein PhnE [Pelagibius sp.]|uniref:phosphonate ABC transporter, permease protein PhnE n=1 Tax=Pelagibius sp. TaxID=1931238 RepID=UPI003BAEC2B1